MGIEMLTNLFWLYFTVLNQFPEELANCHDQCGHFLDGKN
jgi:hypothetical protein